MPAVPAGLAVTSGGAGAFLIHHSRYSALAQARPGDDGGPSEGSPRAAGGPAQEAGAGSSWAASTPLPARSAAADRRSPFLMSKASTRGSESISLPTIGTAAQAGSKEAAPGPGRPAAGSAPPPFSALSLGRSARQVEILRGAEHDVGDGLQRGAGLQQWGERRHTHRVGLTPQRLQVESVHRVGRPLRGGQNGQRHLL